MIDEVERSGLSAEQQAKVDSLCDNYGGLPVFLSGRLGDEWCIVIVGYDSGDCAFAVHLDGHSFGTAATWIDDLPLVAESVDEDEAKRVERLDSLERQQQQD